MLSYEYCIDEEVKMEKISLLGCSTYDYNEVKTTLTKSIEDLGGLKSYITKGETILLKVNLLMKRKPEEATTTHPTFVHALADLLVEYGVKVIIGDSPGGPFNEKALKGIYEVCGYSELADGNIELNDNYNSVEMYCNEAKLMKKLDVIEIITKVDKVISVSKLKTHGMTKFTGAVKNMYGTIPGLKKAEYHYTLPNIEDFSDMLVDVCVNAKPVLSFMDGIVGMEGAGPSSGTPRDVGVVIGSSSPYHLDVIACKIINISPESVPTIKRTMERSIVKSDFSDIEMVSDVVEKFIIKDFKVPSISGVGLLKNSVPKWFDNIVDFMIKPKPVIMRSKCISCGECSICCPASTIEMINGKPKIKLKKCIRCFCCQELCPVKAVKIKRNPIVEKLMKI